jgi:hypothetical protein
MARPDDWIDRTVVIGTDMYGGDTVGRLEEVSDRGVVVRHGIVEVEIEEVEIEEVEIEEVEIEADPEGVVVEIESEIESEPMLQSIFYPWAKVNWMYHPEE